MFETKSENSLINRKRLLDTLKSVPIEFVCTFTRAAWNGFHLTNCKRAVECSNCRKKFCVAPREINACLSVAIH